MKCQMKCVRLSTGHVLRQRLWSSDKMCFVCFAFFSSSAFSSLRRWVVVSGNHCFRSGSSVDTEKENYRMKFFAIRNDVNLDCCCCCCSQHNEGKMKNLLCNYTIGYEVSALFIKALSMPSVLAIGDLYAKLSFFCEKCASFCTTFSALWSLLRPSKTCMRIGHIKFFWISTWDESQCTCTCTQDTMVWPYLLSTTIELCEVFSILIRKKSTALCKVHSHRL